MIKMNIKPILWKNVEVTGGLLAERQKTIAVNTLEHVFKQYEKKGRIGAALWKEGMPDKPHYYYDSDVAKLIEATAYSMIEFPNTGFRKKIEKIIDNFLSIQEPDGYLNSYFHNVVPGEKWSDLRIKHELYCAGHLIEAAIAWKQATGDDKFLHAMCKYADLICGKFGTGKGQIYSWPGHQEIELALVRLYRLTGEKKYLDTAKFFIMERGVDNSHWLKEAEALNLDSDEIKNTFVTFQAYLPAKQQDTAEGHAVRAGYFFSAMADIVLETGNEELWNSCKKIWRNIVDKRMNVTGGIGSDWQREIFTFDYDLPEEYYYETCAQISLFFFAWRMFLNEQKAEYIDIMELTLYNSILSGIDTAGKAFFYSNPLVNFKRDYKHGRDLPEHWGASVRLEDFRCSCCPPNISRFIASIGQYIYAANNNNVWINLFIDSKTRLALDDGISGLNIKTDYPWDENISIEISGEKPLSYKLHIRIPAWARNFDLQINGGNAEYTLQNGYAVIDRQWSDGDRIDLHLPMPVEMLEAHPLVRQASGKTALKCGPVVYCVEEVDNSAGIFNIAVPSDTRFSVRMQDVNGFELPILEFKARRRKVQANESLYHPVNSVYEIIDAKAIPYFMWANRGESEMTVWLKRI
jgi:hypothetical protein